MVAPKLRSFANGPRATASDPGTFMARADVLTPAGEVRTRQGTFQTLAQSQPLRELRPAH
jgi:hypothetical protein